MTGTNGEPLYQDRYEVARARILNQLYEACKGLHFVFPEEVRYPYDGSEETRLQQTIQKIKENYADLQNLDRLIGG